MTQDSEEDLANALRRAVRPILESLPQPFGQRVLGLEVLREIFLEEFAASLQPSLNSYLADQKYDDFAARKATAASVNSCLSTFGLRIRGPKNHPAMLHVDPPPPNDPGPATIRIIVKDRRIHPPRHVKWPNIELMVQPYDIRRDYGRFFSDIDPLEQGR